MTTVTNNRSTSKKGTDGQARKGQGRAKGVEGAASAGKVSFSDKTAQVPASAQNAVASDEASTFAPKKVSKSGPALAAVSPLEAEKQKWLSAFTNEQGVLPPKLKLEIVSGLDSPTWRDGKVPTRAELESVMKALRDDASFAWPYIIDGCNARAHLISEKLQESNFRHAKLFIDDKGAASKLKGSNAFFGSGDFSWDNHVAVPVAFTEEGGTGEVQFGIIDLAVSEQVLNPFDWLKALRAQAIDVRLDLMSVTQYDKPTGKEGIQKLTFSEGVSLARARLEALREVVKDLKPRPRQLLKQGRPLDTFRPEPVEDAKGKLVGWRFTEYAESDYKQIFLGGSSSVYQRTANAKPTFSFIDTTGRAVPTLP